MTFVGEFYRGVSVVQISQSRQSGGSVARTRESEVSSKCNLKADQCSAVQSSRVESSRVESTPSLGTAEGRGLRGANNARAPSEHVLYAERRLGWCLYCAVKCTRALLQSTQ
jgi:hypothetical protein